jgi:type I restriction enzyme, S subunit
MEKQVNLPKLRFHEFTNTWEKKKLGEVTTYVDYRGRAPIKTDEGIFLVTAKNIKKGYIDYENSKEYVADDNYHNVMSKGLPEIGDILFTTEAPMGNVAQVDNKSIALAQRVIKFRGKDNVSNLYLLHYMLSDIFQNKLVEKAIGTTVQGISGKELHKIKVDYPTLPEQQKIASFLSAVDEKLHALKKKKSLLDQYKKGVMQKIFSQELKFRDDHGNEFAEWEVKKLGVIFNSEKGKGISKNKVVDDGKYECVLYGELYTRYKEVIFEIVSKTNEIDGTNSKKGDLLIPSSTTTTGIDLANVTALNKDNVLLGGDITILRSTEKINNVFYAYYLSNYKKEEIASYAQGSTIVHLYYSHIKDMIIDLPSFHEQTKIANFLSAIDEKIQLVQGQLDKMEVWKKGLLQQMFV